MAKKCSNFILVHYKRDIISDGVPLYAKALFTQKMLNIWHRAQSVSLFNQIKSIRLLYPDAKIHLLTDQKIQIDGIIIHNREMPNNHHAKFLIFGLLDEPALYLDTDVLLNRAFLDIHFLCNHSFNVFSSRKSHFAKAACRSLPFFANDHYNGCVIWIKEPSVNITTRLQDINEYYFSDKDKILKAGFWPGNDEYALSFFIKERGWKMHLHKDVAVPRKHVTDLKYPQSVHYGGIKEKLTYLQETTSFFI